LGYGPKGRTRTMVRKSQSGSENLPAKRAKTPLEELTRSGLVPNLQNFKSRILSSFSRKVIYTSYTPKAGRHPRDTCCPNSSWRCCVPNSYSHNCSCELQHACSRRTEQGVRAHD